MNAQQNNLQPYGAAHVDDLRDLYSRNPVSNRRLTSL